MNGTPWPSRAVATLICMYADHPTADVARAVGRTVNQVHQKAAALGLRKSKAFYICGTHPNCRHTQFKRGRPASESANYVPIGSYRLSKDGYLEQKVTDDPSIAPVRRWTGVHRLVWESANGPVPKGHVVCFLPGRRSAELEKITLDALELVSRGELARRNHPRSRDPDLAKLVQIKGAITRQVNRIAREAKEQES